MTSISSCVDLNSQSVVPSIGSQGMGLCLEFRSTTTVHSHQKVSSNKFRLLGCNLFRPLILKMDRFITTLGSILAFITLFFTNSSFVTMLFTNFLVHHDVLVTFLPFPKLSSKALRHVTRSTNSFSSLLRSPTSFLRYQSNTSLM